MFADSDFSIIPSGQLQPGLFPAGTSLKKILGFIGAQIVIWRDREDRPQAEAEDLLTDQLCAHLLSASKFHRFDFLQFRREPRDEANASRKYDLIIAPNCAVIEVAGRKHTEFDILFPLECKRLPTPKGPDRDEREYLFSSTKTTGGVQRFKAGHHASTHRTAGMIAYIQESDIPGWTSKVGSWIDGLLSDKTPGWSDDDRLQASPDNVAPYMAQFTSVHEREKSLEPITLHHFWVDLAMAPQN